MPEITIDLKCKECLPMRVKTQGDLDSTSSEVSLSELDVSMEWFDTVLA